jgi:hypothetical protein
MKIVKLLLFHLMLNLLISPLITCKRSQFRNDYDFRLAEVLVEKIFSKLIDPTKDSEQMYTNCINLVSKNGSKEQARKSFWNSILKKYENKKLFSNKQATKFLSNANLELVSSGKTFKCGDYIQGLLLPEQQIQSELVQSGIRAEVDKVLAHTSKHKRNQNKLITHLISDRGNNLLSKESFKKLNTRR